MDPAYVTPELREPIRTRQICRGRKYASLQSRGKALLDGLQGVNIEPTWNKAFRILRKTVCEFPLDGPEGLRLPAVTLIRKNMGILTLDAQVSKPRG
jgi:hypothetical protein